MADLQAELNRLAGTVGLDAAGAANVGAGTDGLELVGALNAWAGTSGLELNGALRALAAVVGGDPSKDGPGALAGAPGALLAAGAWRISAATDATGADLAGGNDATFLPTGGSDYGPVFVSPALDGPAVALRVDDGAMRLLQEYDWPGNIRELENVCERASVLVLDGILTVHTLAPWLNGVHRSEAFERQLRYGHLLEDMERQVGVREEDHVGERKDGDVHRPVARLRALPRAAPGLASPPARWASSSPRWPPWGTCWGVS